MQVYAPARIIDNTRMQRNSRIHARTVDGMGREDDNTSTSTATPRDDNTNANRNDNTKQETHNSVDNYGTETANIVNDTAAWVDNGNGGTDHSNTYTNNRARHGKNGWACLNTTAPHTEQPNTIATQSNCGDRGTFSSADGNLPSCLRDTTGTACTNPLTATTPNAPPNKLYPHTDDLVSSTKNMRGLNCWRSR